MKSSTSACADVLVIGAGIAGAGAAYELAEFASVIILEAESRYGYHATGRSAASFSKRSPAGWPSVSFTSLK